MTIVYPMQNNMNAGEVDPRLYSRIDIERLRGALAQCSNAIPEVQGSVSRRGGTRFIAETKTTAARSRLISFEFSITQTYVLELGVGYIRIYKNQAPLLSSGSPVEVTGTVPYAVGQLDDVQYTQSADTLYLFHRNHPPQKVVREADEAVWSIEPLDLIDGPYMDLTTDPSPVYQPPVVQFNGADSYNTLGGVTGMADGKLGSVSFWLKMGQDTGAAGVVYNLRDAAGTANSFYVRRETTGAIGIVGLNAAGSQILGFATPTGIARAGTGWLHILASWDLADTDNRHLYVNGESALTVLVYTDDDVEYSGADGSIGASTTGTLFLDGHLADFWFDPTYTDFSVEANRLKFLTADVEPVDLGADGSLPTGTQPAVFMNFGTTEWNSSTAHNSGSANGFVTAGGDSITDSQLLAGDSNTIITLSSVTGTGITMEATADLFNADHVGALWMLREAKDVATAPQWQSGIDVAQGDLYQNDGEVYEALNSDTTGTNSPNQLEGVFDDGQTGADGVDWLWIHDGHGYVVITAFISATQVTVDVKKRVPASVRDGGTKYWREGALSEVRGYPSTGTFFEQRLWVASTTAQPQTIWGSTTGDFLNHEPGSLADSALNYTIDSDQVNAIQWLAAGKILVAGTSGGPYNITASDLDQGITPANIRITPSTRNGAALARPLNIDSQVVFIERLGRKIREFAFVFAQDTYRAPDISILAGHLFVGGVKEAAYSFTPDPVIWVVHNDGRLLACAYDRDQEVVGWAPQTLGGTDTVVESVAVIPGATRSELWLIVARTVDGATVRYVELLEPGLDEAALLADAFFVDSGVTVTGTDLAVATGLDHLEGETVAILADGAVQPDQVVSGGQVTLSPTADKAQVGLPYTTNIETLPLDLLVGSGSTVGRQKRISNVYIKVLNTDAMEVGTDAADLNVVPFREVGDPMGESVPLRSVTPKIAMSGGWDTAVQSYLHNVNLMSGLEPIAIATLMSGAAGVGASVLGGIQTQKTAEANAKLKLLEAAQSRRAALVDENASRRETESLLAQQTAAFAAGGVQLTGTPIEVGVAQATEGEKEAQGIRFEGELAATVAEFEADLLEAQGASAKKAGIVGGALSLAGSVATVGLGGGLFSSGGAAGGISAGAAGPSVKGIVDPFSQLLS